MFNLYVGWAILSITENCMHTLSVCVCRTQFLSLLQLQAHSVELQFTANANLLAYARGQLRNLSYFFKVFDSYKVSESLFT